MTTVSVLLLLAACRSPSAADPTPARSTAALAASAPSAPGPTAPLADEAADRRVLVEASQAGNFFFGKPQKGQTFFTPTAAEVAAFEAALTPELRARVAPSRPGTKPLAERWPTYHRQYVGHLEPDGSRWLWGNFFCHVDPDDQGRWRQQSVVVKDGGDCYFQVDFSPSSRTLKDLSVNGEG